MIDRDLAGAHPVPDRNDAERDRPIAGILPDRGIPVVHQLVAVVFEFLAKEIQHRPASWQAEQRKPYFLAKAGMALAD